MQFCYRGVYHFVVLITHIVQSGETGGGAIAADLGAWKLTTLFVELMEVGRRRREERGKRIEG